MHGFEAGGSLAFAGWEVLLLCVLPCRLQLFSLKSSAIVSLLLAVSKSALLNMTVVIMLSLHTGRGHI